MKFKMTKVAKNMIEIRICGSMTKLLSPKV